VAALATLNIDQRRSPDGALASVGLTTVRPPNVSVTTSDDTRLSVPTASGTGSSNQSFP